MLTKYQKFEPVTINRKDIKNAPYNPRRISDFALNKLKKNIKKIGYLGGIVWNATTGNIVSGHQRLGILDGLEKTDDYELTVEKVELTEKEEIEQNVFFNNTTVQGEFDPEKIQALKIFDVDYDNMGFDEMDLALLDIEEDNLIETVESNDIAEVKAKTKERRKQYKKDQDENSDFTNFIAIVFKNTQDKYEFLEKFKLSNLENTNHIDGKMFERVIEKHYKVVE